MPLLHGHTPIPLLYMNTPQCHSYVDTPPMPEHTNLSIWSTDKSVDIQNFNESHFSFQNGQSHSNADTRSSSKWNISIGMTAGLSFRTKSTRRQIQSCMYLCVYTHIHTHTCTHTYTHTHTHNTHMYINVHTNDTLHTFPDQTSPDQSISLVYDGRHRWGKL